MGYCTGSGTETGDHCCYVGNNEDGTPKVCPHLMDQTSMIAWINNQGWGATKRNAAMQFVQGINWLCRIGINVLADVNAARSNRPRYETEFAKNADYLAFPAPYWRKVESESNGLIPAGSLDCYKWKDPGNTCCFRKTTTQCDTEAANRGITTAAVTIRKAGGKAD